MNNWQKEVSDKLKGFVDNCSSASEEDTVMISLNRKEAYVLVGIIDQWQELKHPLLCVKPSEA